MYQHMMQHSLACRIIYASWYILNGGMPERVIRGPYWVVLHSKFAVGCRAGQHVSSQARQGNSILSCHTEQLLQ